MKKHILILGACALALMACNKVQTDGPEADFSDNQIVFTTRAEAGTRATGVTEVGNGQNGTQELTSFNVIASKGTSNQTAYFTDGVFTGTYNTSYKGGKYWPADETTTDTWNFYASNATMTFNPSGATIAVSDCNVDVVAEYKSNASYRQSNNLVFDHILCQLATVTMKAPEGYTVNNLTVTIVPVFNGVYNMVTNTWQVGTPAATATTIFSANLTEGGQATSSDNDLWLLPGRYQVHASYTLVKGEFSKEYTKSAYVDLVQGVNNHLRLPGPNHDQPNIPGPDQGDEVEVAFTVEVTPWSDGYVDVDFRS